MTDLREIGELSTGELLDGRYRLLERIGEGGMARVYRAEDLSLHRTIAIKVLRGQADGLGSVERAMAETTALATLNHHALVTLFDAHISEYDVSYLVMEFVEGITLRDLIARGPVDAAVAASLTVDIAEALHVAHDSGIVHRDIKPSNVLLWESPLPGRPWRAKLADFGIAHLLDSNRVTSPGLMVGTVAYIAPEQARGAPPAPPADIYALGIMLIEALTGSRPFAEAEGFGAVMARLENPPAIPDTLHPAWQGLLRGMTALRPDDRPTALEVALTASKLAAAGAGVVPSGPPPVDQPTAAAPAVVLAETRPTEILAVGGSQGWGAGTLTPVAAVDASEATSSAAATPARLRRRERPQARRRRRRLVVAAIVAAVVILLGLLAASLVFAQSGGDPEPTPSTPVVEQPVPTETPPAAPAQEPTTVTEQTPTTETDTGVAVDPGTGTTGGATGGDNPNSGPGNNNGNGNGGTGGNGGGNGNGR